MNIEAKGFKVEFEQSELWQIAWDLKYHLTSTIKTHWVNHQLNWKQNEANRLMIIKLMFSNLGRIEYYEDIFSQAEEIFKEFNNKETK